MDANEYLDEVEKRAEAATSGPWFAHPAGKYVYDRPNGQIIDGCVENTDINAVANMAFTAASRTDVPKMAKALRAVLKVTNMHQARMTMGEIDPGNTSFSDGHQIGWLKGEANMSEKVRRAITEALEGEE